MSNPSGSSGSGVQRARPSAVATELSASARYRRTPLVVLEARVSRWVVRLRTADGSASVGVVFQDSGGGGVVGVGHPVQEVVDAAVAEGGGV